MEKLPLALVLASLALLALYNLAPVLRAPAEWDAEPDPDCPACDAAGWRYEGD